MSVSNTVIKIRVRGEGGEAVGRTRAVATRRKNLKVIMCCLYNNYYREYCNMGMSPYLYKNKDFQLGF